MAALTPNQANVFMGIVEVKYVHSFIHKNIATLYLHFIDDASLILHINRNLRVVNPLSVSVALI